MAKLGTSGGVDLLPKEDRAKVDSEELERIEPLNDRLQDSLSSALQTVLRRDPGGYIANRQYMVDHGEGSRPTDISFDRFYYSLNLLVDLLQSPMNDPDRLANVDHINEHAKFAAQHGIKYLPIVGGATLGEIEAALH